MTIPDSSAKILVVDDNMMTITIVKSLLAEMNLNGIDTASNGQDAWDKISSAMTAKAPYDIVIMDWNMPIMTGYEVLRRCREEPQLGGMAIVMLTAENQKRSILEATKTGATSYMVKPVDKDEFREKIGQVFTWMSKNKSVA